MNFARGAYRADLARMTAAIHHRGPDDDGFFRGDGVALGMRRLSIIDLANGQQPIWNEDESCCIVYNGELYNFRELRPQLAALGHVFRTQSDTEVVLHAYEQWGVDCLSRFNGMFALALWDGRTRTLLLARDRIGEKPLYYFRDRERLV
ncbi:MAG: asparagine synthetase B, partial [Chloroflexi bacterium]|nr:asparagine synthetase B [Chloroflexota bacterium]